ncbi:MAG: DEAD/DEAH box helicase family protein, partial [Solirubrobacterales bacterium]
MAKTSDVAAPAAVPSSADIERAAKFVREPFLLDGEGPEALAPGTARRRALDAALREIDAGVEDPSIQWRRDFSLLLGLERLLADEPPKLRDGAELNPHQVDALSGTLTELMAEQQIAIEGEANGKGAAEVAETADPDPTAEEPSEDGAEANGEAELEDEDLAPDEEPQDWEEASADDEETIEEAPEDPGAERRFWFEHATGAGKTVAAVGFIDASRAGGVLILTHRRNLVDQFIGEISERGYKERLRPPLLDGRDDPDGPVTVETYQWFVRNHKKISDAYSIVICDEAHTALGEKTSACIRAWVGPVFIGMTATGALIARHVADLFPTQTSRFDLIQAARRGVISPLRCMRIPPGPGVRTIAKVPLRKGEVDQDFDQEELAALLDQEPFNVAIADLYKTRFDGMPGVLYTAGVQHAKNVARALQSAGVAARAVSGETPKRELAEILAGFERGEIDVLCNAMLLAEGWNSPRATLCMHLAPTASRRIYQQRVGHVTRRAPGKEAGLVIDFVHPATTHDEAIVTLHSLLDRDVYRGGAIVIGPVRRSRGRRIRVERRIVPVSDNEERRMHVLEREMWRIAVDNLDYPEHFNKDVFWNWVGKVDHNFSSNDRVFFRWGENKRNEIRNTTAIRSGPAQNGQLPLWRANRALVADWVHVFGAGTVFNLRSSYTYFLEWSYSQDSLGFNSSEFWPSNLVSQLPSQAINGIFPVVNMEDYVTLSRGSSPNPNRNYNLQPNISQSRGDHKIRSGLDIRWTNVYNENYNNSGGNISFTRAFTRSTLNSTSVLEGNAFAT